MKEALHSGEEYGIMIFDEGETIHEHAQPEDFTPPNPDMVTFVIDFNKGESVSDRYTIQIGDDIYEEDLPKPHVQYTPHQIKHLHMKDPSLALKN